MFPSIQSLCQKYEASFALIPAERKKVLKQLSVYISNKQKEGIIPQIIVVCTHNSRRSHLGQIWLSVAIDYYQASTIKTFSGGTEATAFNPRAISALKRIGFDITTKEATVTNPQYTVKWSKNTAPSIAFSKKYTHPSNPQGHFAAVMVCMEADAGCPIVSGNDFRLTLPYDDPKAFDGTPLEKEKYEERCHQIGREMLYVVKMIKGIRP